METLNLNLIPTGANPVAHVSQYDEGRVIRFNLFEGSAVYTLDGTETIECDVKKPDGNVVTLSVPNTSDSYVDVTTTLQTCACAGDNLADIKITKGAVIIATLNFILSVERSPLENGIESDSEIHNLEQQIADAVADQYDADSVIFDSVPTAGHGIGYAVTSEGVLNSIPEELDDLSDVTTTAPTSGEALVWDGSKWTNGMPSVDLDDLGDVEITTPTAGEILEFDGAEWVNVPNPASTTNFGAPYDESTTYNVPSLVIYNNLLYKLNEGEDGTTGPWDPTKWTQTSVAELAALIGSLSTLTTTDKSSVVGAVNEVNGKTTVKNITSSSKVSGVEGGYIKMGNLVIVSVDFTLAQTATVGESLFSGLPIPKTNDTSLSMYQTVYPPNATNVGARVFGANGSGNLYANTALNTTNNKYHIFGIYKDNS